MKLNGLHLLLTYQCTFECDHCFVWGSPRQTGTMTMKDIRAILQQAKDTGTVQWIFFEGGEPFLYYPLMLWGARQASQMGFHVGLVSNAYWANSAEDAQEYLQPFVGVIEDLSISSDLYHYSDRMSLQAQNAVAAAGQLGIPLGVLSIAQPEDTNILLSKGKIPTGDSMVMYRGRASCKLVARAALQPWQTFVECPHEDLREPGRVHVDPFGNLHVCQGISLGNLFEQSLGEICVHYEPASHPIIGLLLDGGPAALVKEYSLPHEDRYADACHLCYEARKILRPRFSQILRPDQMYGVESD